MIKTGDLVKVTGKTLAGDGTEKELIPIGTICKVLEAYTDEKGRAVVEIAPHDYNWNKGYHYLEKDVEKGRLEWIPDNDNENTSPCSECRVVQTVDEYANNPELDDEYPSLSECDFTSVVFLQKVVAKIAELVNATIYFAKEDNGSLTWDLDLNAQDMFAYMKNESGKGLYFCCCDSKNHTDYTISTVTGGAQTVNEFIEGAADIVQMTRDLQDA